MISQEELKQKLQKESQEVPLVFKKSPISKEVGAENSFDNYGIESLDSMFKKLKISDQSFINSILSFSVYKENEWIGKSLKKELYEMRDYLEKSFDDKEEMYKLKIWHFMKNTFEKIPDNKLKIPAQNIVMNDYKYVTNFMFKDGEYSANKDLAHASIMTSNEPEGKGKILHLTFRGTEFSRLGEYLLGPYLDMTAYYQNFKPLEKYIKEYVSDPNNNIVGLHVNGHSLGGAMVQQFLKNNPEKDYPVPISGFTFGSPGSEKKWYHKFLTVGYHALTRGVAVPTEEHTFSKDSRIHEFYHSNDPIPKVGILGYKKSGTTYNLLDSLHSESKSANLEKKSFLEKIPVFGGMVTYFKEHVVNKFNTKFHGSARYIMNIRSVIEDHFNAYPQFGFEIKDTSKYWEHWVKQEKQFGALSIKQKGAFEYLIEKNNPGFDSLQINNQILKVRENMKYDSKAELILSKTRRTNDGYDQFLRGESSKVNSAVAISNAEQIMGSIPLNQRVKALREMYDEIMEKRTNVFKK
jgi:hypothetical protein